MLVGLFIKLCDLHSVLDFVGLPVGVAFCGTCLFGGILDACRWWVF